MIYQNARNTGFWFCGMHCNSKYSKHWAVVWCLTYGTLNVFIWFRSGVPRVLIKEYCGIDSIVLWYTNGVSKKACQLPVQWYCGLMPESKCSQKILLKYLQALERLNSCHKREWAFLGEGVICKEGEGECKHQSMTTSTVKIKNLFLFLLFFSKSFDHITFTIHLVIREDAIGT